MNIWRKCTAAIVSVTLNVALALVLSQGAGAATPSTIHQAPGLQTHTVNQRAGMPVLEAPCVARIKTRAIIAVLLAIVV
jgi:hypothetical protein